MVNTAAISIFSMSQTPYIYLLTLCDLIWNTLVKHSLNLQVKPESSGLNKILGKSL